MIKILSSVLLFLFLMLSGCKSTPTSTTNPTKIPEKPTLIETRTPTKTITPTSSSTPIAIPSSTTTPTLSISPTSHQSPTPLSTPKNGTRNLVIDHQAVELFDHLPDKYIQAASNILWLHRHASVGANIRFGLDCLNNSFPERADLNRRPSACDKGIEAVDIVYDEKYVSDNWLFEVHAEPNPNPGWYKKSNNFIDRINNLEESENFDFASYNMGYVEDPSIIDHFFSNSSIDDAFPSVFDLEDLENQYPEITIIWWTIALARKTDPHILDFNQQMRDYATTNDKILLDIADIESHLPDGTPCTGVDASNNPTNLTAICPEYTDEKFSGHLNALGRARMAKAIWVMMALLSGWDGNSP